MQIQNPQPSHLTLGEVIQRLKAADPDERVALGFRHPCSYRGYYEQCAFVLAPNVTVAEMLAAAESALFATFQGWKGGDYEMREYTDCWLVAHPGDCGESMGAVLLELLLANVAGDPALVLEAT